MSGVEFVDLVPAGSELSVTMLTGGERIPIWYRSSVPLAAERADALVPVGLLAAMRTRRPLRLPLPVSPVLLANLPRIQDILHAFSDGELSVVPVEAETAPAARAPAGRGTAAFFSGGVDAFYTVLEHEPELTHLVFLQGFDVIDASSPKGVAAAAGARTVAAALDKTLVEVETNVRLVCRRFGTGTTTWGAALASVALLLQCELERILIAGSDSYATLVPWGSHPLLDPLFGTDALGIEHDGCEATRVQKVERIASSALAREHLRVCPEQLAELNCGRCEKCLRTMTTLRLIGALEQCPTFPDTLDRRTLARFPMAELPSGCFTRENVRLAREVGDWPVSGALMWSLRPRPLLRAKVRAHAFIRRASTRTDG